MNLPLLNRNFELPADQWYHVMPLGEYPHPEGLTQVLDAGAADAMVNRFRTDQAQPHFPGLLVDFDHFSDDLKQPSEAAGWIQALENRADGLWARILWSDNGEAAIRGRRYRYLSPVWNRDECADLGSNRVRPLRLDRAAITNDPNIKGMRPLANRSDNTAPADPGNEPEPGSTGRKESMMDYKQELLAMLGLEADAAVDRGGLDRPVCAVGADALLDLDGELARWSNDHGEGLGGAREALGLPQEGPRQGENRP
jgi:phage I-like protein